MASFKTVLSTAASDAKKVFAWIGAHQTEITAGEATIDSIAPELTGIVSLAQAGLTEAIKIETLSVAAGSQSGSGPQKLSALVSTLTPSVLQYAQANKLPTPTAATIQNAANSLVSFLNSFQAS